MDILPFLPKSDLEAKFYYHGLPSKPRLVARSTPNVWEPPESGPEPFLEKKITKPVENRALKSVWESKAAYMIAACLDGMGTLWNCLDITHIGVVGEAYHPIILWIGVKPRSLFGRDASTAVSRSLGILRECGVTDVEVEIRETDVIRSAGPRLLHPLCDETNPTAAIHRRFSYTLGFPISPESHPNITSSSGFFMRKGSETLLVITRHGSGLHEVVGNAMFEHDTDAEPLFNLIILGDKAYGDCIAALEADICVCKKASDTYAVKMLAEEEGSEGREKARKYKEKRDEDLAALNSFYDEIKKNWALTRNRVLGHIIYSPPICLNASPGGHTVDYAVVKLDDDKIDHHNLANIIDLGSDTNQLAVLMFEDKDIFPDNLDLASGLMTLQGTISDADMGSAMTVFKRGSASDLTFGRASGIKSLARQYGDIIPAAKSWEWAIHPYHEGKAFSERGDSGAVVVDRLGRIGGIITGGAGITDNTDISYATPISCIERSIKAKYPNVQYL